MAPCCKKLAILFLLFSFYCLFHSLESIHSCLAVPLLKLWHPPSKALTLTAAPDRTMANNIKPSPCPEVSELEVCLELTRGKSAKGPCSWEPQRPRPVSNGGEAPSGQLGSDLLWSRGRRTLSTATQMAKTRERGQGHSSAECKCSQKFRYQWSQSSPSWPGPVTREEEGAIPGVK